MSSAVIQLLVLAGVAIFLILKLRSVLGTREGFQKPPAPLSPPGAARSQDGFEVIEGGPDRDISDHVAEDSEVARALAAMKLADPTFTVSGFLQGARAAYEMILMAFERGEIEKVRSFLSEDVYRSFEEVVSDRRSRGLTTTSEFAGLRELALQAVEFDRSTTEAEVTVRFVADLVTSTRDAAGQLVEGNPNAARKQRDVWTFARRMGSSDPNWLLIATGE
ncbi:MAG: Tim44/TimA family putative adaptor protein [Paracoccaceae bacterium]